MVDNSVAAATQNSIKNIGLILSQLALSFVFLVLANAVAGHWQVFIILFVLAVVMNLLWASKLRIYGRKRVFLLVCGACCAL